MHTNKNTGRTAGFIYLAVILTGMFSMAYVPQKLIDWNNSRVTFNNITASPSLFRLAIYSSVLCYTAFTFLPLVLYRFLRTVNESQAKVMVILALLSVPFSFNNLQYKYAALDLTGKASFLQNVSTEDLQSKLMFTLHQHNDGLLLATVFWGLWLFPFGLLVYRSGFIPKLFGILLMLGCAGYLINFTGNTLFENYSQTGIAKYMRMLPAIAEISICFWLLFYGLKRTKMESKGFQYEDHKVNVKLKLSALWAAVMFLYIYGDYFELYVPGKVAGLLSGQHLLNTPYKLLFATILLAIPSLMIFLSILMKPKWNRAFNISIGAFLTLFTLLVGISSFSEWRIFYVLLSFSESMLTSIIVWKTWHWPKN